MRPESFHVTWPHLLEVPVLTELHADGDRVALLGGLGWGVSYWSAGNVLSGFGRCLHAYLTVYVLVLKKMGNSCKRVSCDCQCSEVKSNVIS